MNASKTTIKLYDNWREILRRSWSIRFILLAGVLSGLEVILPFYADSMPRHIFASLSFACVCCAFIARLIAQKGI
jgi:hypothetical protein